MVAVLDSSVAQCYFEVNRRRLPGVSVGDYQLIVDCARGRVRPDFFDDWMSGFVLPYLCQDESAPSSDVSWLDRLGAVDILGDLRRNPSNVFNYVPVHMQDTPEARAFVASGSEFGQLREGNVVRVDISGLDFNSLVRSRLKGGGIRGVRLVQG